MTTIYKLADEKTGDIVAAFSYNSSDQNQNAIFMTDVKSRKPDVNIEIVKIASVEWMAIHSMIHDPNRPPCKIFDEWTDKIRAAILQLVRRYVNPTIAYHGLMMHTWNDSVADI